MVTGTVSDRNPPALHLFRNFEPSEMSSANLAVNVKPFPPPPAPKGNSLKQLMLHLVNKHAQWIKCDEARDLLLNLSGPRNIPDFAGEIHDGTP